MKYDSPIKNLINGEGSGTSQEWLANALLWETEDVPNCESTVPLPPQPSGNAITKVSAHQAVDSSHGWLTSEWRKALLVEIG